MVFSHYHRHFPWPVIIEYYRDRAWLRPGYDHDVEARHKRLARSLVAAWLLHEEVVYFQLATRQWVSMQGYFHRRQGREVELNFHVPPPEETLETHFFVEAGSVNPFGYGEASEKLF